MASDAASLINLYQLSTGRRQHALGEVERRARALSASDIALLAAQALAHDRELAMMEIEVTAGNRNQHGPAAMALDAQVDRALTGIEDYLEVQIRVFGEDSARGRDAAFLGRELFPGGAAAITSRSYVLEHESILALLRRAREDALAEAVARIPELPAMLAQLDALDRQYGESLQDYDRGRPTRDAIKAAQAHGRELMARVVAAILTRHALQPDRTDERDHLLEPILRQSEAVRAARQRRRRPRDIDPSGPGDELDTDPDAPEQA
jgi:hypothetical protein